MEDKENLKPNETQSFYMVKPQMKHPRVDTITTGKANLLYEKDLHTQSYQHYDIHFKLSPPNQPSG